MPNRLADSTSPYLRQHADNPVDWYPWGEEALTRAKAEDKPILLSIGFATCHWCHVMARESFADRAVADIVNDRFVCVKVDREERPDLDRTYLEALQRLTGRAGWPATLFLTPDAEPFFAGTYFPPEPRNGVPGFKRLSTAIDAAWRERRQTLERNARDVTAVLSSADPGAGRTGGDPAAIEAAAAALRDLYDREWGGLGEAPKFPAPPVLELLVERLRRGDADAGTQLELTLRQMAIGGVRDLVGGGFHRYAVDRRWRVPHFEKALVDNALLARAYLNAWKVQGDPLFAQVSRDTLDYLLRELRHEDGGFASGQDAESEGREGGFYVWSFSQLVAAVGREAAFALGALPEGNWEGTNVLRQAGDAAADDLRSWRERLGDARSERTPPARDDKVVTGWNALAIIALADAARALDEHRYLTAAVAAAEFLFARLIRDDGRIMRSWCDGRVSTSGFLDDYAFLGLACLSLHQATLAPLWLERALILADELVRLFADPASRRLFLTGADVESVLTRPVDGGGLALPSATSAGAELLWRTARLTGRSEREQLALDALGPLMAQARDHPEEHSHALALLSLALRPARELALVGDPSSARTRELAAVVWRGHFPDTVVAAAGSGHAPVSLLEGRSAIDGRATAYVCEGMACLRPTSDPAVLAGQLQGAGDDARI